MTGKAGFERFQRAGAERWSRHPGYFWRNCFLRTACPTGYKGLGFAEPGPLFCLQALPFSLLAIPLVDCIFCFRLVLRSGLNNMPTSMRATPLTLQYVHCSGGEDCD